MPDTAAPSPALPTGLMLIHGNRMEALRALAVSWQRRQPLPPLENEHWLVQSQGMAQWLKQALAADPIPAADGLDASGGLGIAAANRFWLPADFLWHAYRLVLGCEQVPAASPLDREMLLWRLLQWLPALHGRPGFEPLQRFLNDDPGLRKRYQLAQKLADLYDQYQVYRADWLDDWAAGRDRLAGLRQGFRPLPAGQRWQAELWRRLRADSGVDGRAETHRAFLKRLENSQQPPAGLPRRLLVFGISSLPAQTLEALAALGRHSQVLVYLHNPCRYHWGDIVADRDLSRQDYRRHPPAPAASDGGGYGHPLLASWGKQGRDLIQLLDVYDQPDRYRPLFQPLNEGRIDLFDGEAPPHLLAQLQNDMLELRELDETRARWDAIDPARDRSIRFHLAHSEQREVEILHDQLLDRFAADPSLKPDDIIVMVPDIDRYAPHIRAVFGRFDRHDSHRIPFQLADQRLAASEPLLQALGGLLQLPDSRFPAGEVLDFLEIPAVQARFGLDRHDLPRLRRWVAASGIRWGLDGNQRSQLGLPAGLEQNSWHFGLQRMLLGYASGAGEVFAGIDPYPEVGGLEAAVLGPLDELLRALDETRCALAAPAPPETWGRRLHAVLSRFFTPQTSAEETLLAQLAGELQRWLERCRQLDFTESLPLGIVRDAWLAAVERGGSGRPFLGGGVHFCSLLPMRAIPFRIVCLLGMQDGAYPRSRPALDFDLMASDYRPGDRSRREDDRYLWLEALLSARDQLYLSWIGRQIRDDSPRPPSVLLAQLRDHLDAGWRLAGDDRRPLSAALSQEHPLQAFSPRYFQTLPAPPAELFSYAGEWLAPPPAPVEPAPSAALPAAFDRLSLDALARFLHRPPGQYFVQRLHTYLPMRPEPTEDQEPFALAPLRRHRLQAAMLQTLRSTADAAGQAAALAAMTQRWQASGVLPLAGFGTLSSAALAAPLQELAAPLAACLRQWPPPIAPRPLRLDMDGLRLEASLELHQGSSGPAILATEAQPLDYGRNSCHWSRLLGPWLRQLFACACRQPAELLLLAPDVSLRLAPLAPALASAQLQPLLAGWRAGMQRPLPVTARTAFAWLTAKAAPLAAAEKTYLSERPHHPALQREFPDFAALLAAGEFEHWANALYRPLLEADWQPFQPGKAFAA